MHSKQRVSTVRRAPTACSIALLRGELLLAVARALQKGRSWPEPTCGWPKSFKFITPKTAESVTIGRRKSVKDGCKEPITAREDVMSTTVAALRETL